MEIIRLAVPFDDGAATPATAAEEVGVATGFTGSKRMEALLVKLETDTGLIGWGEAFGHSINPASFATLTEVVGDFFKDASIDCTGSGVGPIVEQAAQFFHLFGRSGPVTYALSGIDIALWDIKARAAGQPLFKLLGGRRQEIEVYASLVSYAEHTETVARIAKQAYDAGFRNIKLHERTLPAIRAAREALPKGTRLMTDFNCPWRLEEAKAVSHDLAPLDLDWLEEPIFPPDDVHALAKLRSAGFRLAGGENVSGLMGLLHALELGAFDVIQPSVAKIGGISAMLEAFNTIRRFPVSLQPHCYYIGPGLLATAHLLSLLDDALLEVPWLRFEADLYQDYDGGPLFRLQDRPGLGFDPDPALLDRFCVQRQRVF